MTALTFHSMLLACDGYGHAAALTIQSLMANGATVYVSPLIEWNPANSPLEVYRLKDQPVLPTAWGYVMAWPPTLWDACKTPYRMGHTMVEGTRAPAWYVAAVNRMDVITVPSAFVRDVLVASGVTPPIRVVSYDVDPTYYWGDLRRPGLCTFGTLGTLVKRKGTDILLRAFANAFPNEVDVRLEIKTRAVGAWPTTDSRVVVHRGDWAPAQARRWYQSLDAYVSPTRGEGFGLTLVEAMQCGCAVIATNWSGCTEILDPLYSYPLSITGLRPTLADDPAAQDFGEWAVPDEDHLVSLMRHVYAHREEAHMMGLLASRMMPERFFPGRSGRQILDIMQGVVS